MTEEARSEKPALKEFVMRYAPAAIALSVLAGLTGSAVFSQDAHTPDPRAVALAAQGRSQLDAGDTQAAIDRFESALAVDPGYNLIYVYLGDAARRDGLQGKAIHFYREAQERDPENLAAIAGEGSALVEKGAVDKAREKLATLDGLCGSDCAQTQALAAAITRGPTPRVATIELPEDEATAAN